MLDGVRYALSCPSRSRFDFQAAPYAVVSIHRFENIFTGRLTATIIPLLKRVAQQMNLIFVLHPTTRERLLSLGLYDQLAAGPNIVPHERFGFIDWIGVCSEARFVITDGGSNQEELSYLGVPTLLLRTETERREGLGENVVLSSLKQQVIDHFLGHVDDFRRPASLSRARPSDAIIETIRSL